MTFICESRALWRVQSWEHRVAYKYLPQHQMTSTTQLRHLLQVILGCVKLTVKISYHTDATQISYCLTWIVKETGI